MKKKVRKVLFILSTVFIVSGLIMMLLPGMVFGASVEPVLFSPWQSGNAEFECNQAGCGTSTTDAYKFDSWTSGDKSYAPITITENDGKNFNWSSTVNVYCVIVVGANQANVYKYPGGSTGDTALTGPGDHDISHVTFCYGTPTTASVTVNKTDGTNPLDGATIGIFAAIDGPAIETKLSTGGQVIFTGLTPETTYYIHETIAPPGYTPDPAWYSITTGAAGSNTVLETTIVNIPIVTEIGITVVKTSSGFSSGVFTFALLQLQENGEDTFVEIDEGTIPFGGGSLTFAPLEPGTYKVEEIGTNGADGTTVSDTLGPIAVVGVIEVLSDEIIIDDISATVYFDNILIPPIITSTPGSFAFSKIFEDLAAPLPAPGAVFSLFNTGTTTLAVIGGTNPISLTENGTVSFTGIPAGTYDIVETIVPEGYIQMASMIISVDAAGNVTVLEPGSLVGTTVTNTPVLALVEESPPSRRRTEATVEVLGTQELPFTGNDSLFKIIGGSFILLGLALALYALNNKKAFQFLKK